jgi:hypothetical protein
LEEKARIVAESLDPATTSSAVARRYGLHTSQLTWGSCRQGRVSGDHSYPRSCIGIQVEPVILTLASPHQIKLTFGRPLRAVPLSRFRRVRLRRATPFSLPGF